MSRFSNFLWGASAICCALFVGPASFPALAQPSEAQLEKALDVMDKSASSSWNGPAPAGMQNGTQAPSSMPSNMVPAQSPFVSAPSRPIFNPPPPSSQSAATNPFTLQNALRIMLGGSSSSSSPSGAGVSGNDSENLSTALNQKQQAIDACNSISGELDKGVKEGLASQAQDHANAASYAADALYNASNNSKSQEVHNMASRARNAANEAQSYADRARSKADGGGW